MKIDLYMSKQTKSIADLFDRPYGNNNSDYLLFTIDRTTTNSEIIGISKIAKFRGVIFNALGNYGLYCH